LVNELSQRRSTLTFATNAIGDKLLQRGAVESRNPDMPHHRPGPADGLELANQGMGRIDLIVPVGANDQQMTHVRLGQQIFQQIERRGVQPLQIVEEQRERMLRPRKYTDESTEHELKASLRILRRNLGDSWLLSDDELQFGDQIHHEL